MSNQKSRGSPRRPAAIPVRLFGQDVLGRDFSEDTSTLVVNWNGALISLTRPVANEQVLLVVNRKNNKESEFRVVGKNANEVLNAEGWGMECLNPDQDFWDLKDPWDLGGPSRLDA